MSEVHRWEAIHMKDGDNNIRYQDGTGPDMVKASDYDQLKADYAEIESALVTKNHEAHDLEIENRQLKAELEGAEAKVADMLRQSRERNTKLRVERDALRTKMDEARELLAGTMQYISAEELDHFEARIGAWLEANKT